MTHKIYASSPIEMKELYTFNRIQGMAKPTQWSLAKHIRSKARAAWRDVEKGTLGCHTFELVTALREGKANVAPDADSGIWVAKRILDGAIDAGVIPDDSPLYVASVHIVAATFVKLDPRVRVSYVGVFRPPIEPTVDIYV